MNFATYSLILLFAWPFKDMAAGVEEGLDTRMVIKKYEGSKTAKDVIRETLTYTGVDVPVVDPMEKRMREKYAAEPRPLTSNEFAASMDRLARDRPASH